MPLDRWHVVQSNLRSAIGPDLVNGLAVNLIIELSRRSYEDIQELSDNLEAKPAIVKRWIDYLVKQGLLEITPDGAYQTTGSTKSLVIEVLKQAFQLKD